MHKKETEKAIAKHNDGKKYSDHHYAGVSKHNPKHEVISKGHKSRSRHKNEG